MRAGRLCASAPSDLFPEYYAAGMGPRPPGGAAMFGGGGGSTGSTKRFLPAGGLLPGFPRTAGARQATGLMGSGGDAWDFGDVGRGGGGDTGGGGDCGEDKTAREGNAIIAAEEDERRRKPEQQGDAAEWQQGETTQTPSQETVLPAAVTGHDDLQKQQDLLWQQQQRRRQQQEDGEGGEGGGGSARQDRSFVGTQEAATTAERFALYSKEETADGTILSSHPQLDSRSSLLDLQQAQQHRLLAPRFAGDHTSTSSLLVVNQDGNNGGTGTAVQVLPRSGTSHLMSENHPATTTTGTAAAVSSRGGRATTLVKNAKGRRSACTTAGKSRVNAGRRASSRGARVLLPGEGARSYSSLLKGIDSVRGRELESRVATAEAEVRTQVEAPSGISRPSALYLSR